MIAGVATPDGTDRYRARFADRVSPEHFRELPSGVRLSTIGLGTYLGREDEVTDTLYRSAVERAVQRGINVVDTAVNYRQQRSERAIGAALERLIEGGTVSRDEIVIATKGGFIPLDADAGQDPRAYVTDTYLKPGVIRPDDVVAGMHCMTPRYLEDQIERSRRNLGVETIDVYYLHNPETQLEAIDRGEFLKRVRDAFATLERAVALGKLQCYGVATWNGFRQDPGTPGYLSLDELVQTARSAGGDAHHFAVIQLPYNLAMPEAFTRGTQLVDGMMVPTLTAAARFGVYAMASASVHQGQLARGLPPVIADYLPGLATDAQRALQFVRSTPGIGTALVGMKTVAHVEENAAVAEVAPVPWTEFKRLFNDSDSSAG